MSEKIAIKFNNNTCNAYVENSFEALKTILEESNIKRLNIISDNEGKKYLAVIKNLLNTIELTESDEVSNDFLNLVIGNDILISNVSAKENISFAIIPTSFKAIADYSIFSQSYPVIIFENTEIIKDLSDKDFYNNFSYVMRLGIVKNLKFYMWLIDNLYEISDKEADTLNEMLLKITDINKAIIESKELFPLSFGCEFANALYGILSNEFSMGECLALGMIASAHISWKMDLIKMEYFYELRDMFVPFNLPISIESNKLKDIEKAFKYLNDDNSMTLIKAIGRSGLTGDIPASLIYESIDFLNFDLD